MEKTDKLEAEASEESHLEPVWSLPREVYGESLGERERGLGVCVLGRGGNTLFFTLPLSISDISLSEVGSHFTDFPLDAFFF